jgi:very-short-patch-repair endonuclease
MPIDPSLHAWAVTRGNVFTYGEARARGISDTELRRWLRAGEVVTPRRGAYLLGPAWAASRDVGRLALRTKAVLATRPDSVASHQSALALHGLPVHGVPLDTVDVIGAVRRVRARPGLRVHGWALGESGRASDLDRVPHVAADGYRCVPVATAIAQVAFRSGALAGLVPLDRALHDRRCTVEEVGTAVSGLARRPGHRRVGEVLLRSADPACESVGETRTRLLLTALGLQPRSQVVIADDRGAFLGRVDFLVGERVIVEFDGLVKYGGADGTAALVAEKAREDALREAGYVVIRIVWSDLDHPAEVARRIRRAVAQVSSRGAVIAAP